jgi:predicted amino acid racemase
MAFIKLYRKRLRHNYNYIENVFRQNRIEWGIVTKLLCGNRIYLEEVVNLNIRQLLDSRLSHLRVIKKIAPHIQTVYIKPPAKRSITGIIKFADVSFNTQYETILFLSKEAMRQKKLHKIILMIEMGDLREGIMGEKLVSFYQKVFNLPNIRIVGIGTNLNCLHGVMPSQDKLIQLSLYKQLLETKLKKKIKWVSGGTSVMFPMIFKKQIPKNINHFRIGETLYFGMNLITGKKFSDMRDDVFVLSSEIIEIEEKPALPFGELGLNPSGEMMEIDKNLYGKKQTRAIIDIGLLDINPDFLISADKKINIVAASSDMLVLDISDSDKNYRVGDLVNFKLKYMGALGIMNSMYIDKYVV